MARFPTARFGKWFLLTAVVVVNHAHGQTAPDDDLAKELPRIKPLEAEAALRSFQIPPGFRLEAVAVEPIVRDPVAVCYDADGRLYVVEMRGYPYPEKSPTGEIRLLEDRDGDGRFERATVFVDGLSWPTGVVPYDGGVFIAVAPEILYAKDTNGDGVADVKRVMFRGFGTNNVQGLLNGLLWGPDGWIYGVSGGNGGDIQNLTRPDAKPVSVRGRDFRFKPDGSAFEAISGGGQFGHAFDDWGHRFTCNNSDHIRQIVLPSSSLERNPALIVDSVIASIGAEGAAAPVYRISAAEPWRVVRTRQRAADPVLSKRLAATELVPIGFFTSATGVTIYRGDAFPAEYHGNAFIGDVGGNLVHRKTLTKNGTTYLAKRAEPGHEFLPSTDNWFRPVNFANTPDGTLLVIDMYRETIEHPLSIPEPIKKHLDLTSGKDLGRLYSLVPEKGLRRRRPQLSQAKTADLVPLLADGSAWWRETAQRLLIERNDRQAVPPLKGLAATSTSPLGRAHALWTLDALGALSEDDLVTAFTAKEPELREQAARLAEGHLRAGSRLTEPLLALASDPDPMVRFQTALSLGGLKDTRGLDALAAIVQKSPSDVWTRAAVLSSLAHRPAAMIDRLAKSGVFGRTGGSRWLDELAVLVGTEGDPAEVKRVFERFASGNASPALSRSVVLGLGRGLERGGSSLRAILDGPAGKTLMPLFETAARTAASTEPDAERVAAIRILALGPIDLAAGALPSLLDARQPSSVQLAAIQALGAIPDRRVGTWILDHWKALSPALRREALEALFARAERVEALLDAVEAKTLPASEIDAARQKQLLSHAQASLRSRAANIFGSATRTDRGKVAEAYRVSLKLTGDREKGRAVFQKVCATCHQAEGKGIDVGPNLATVATRTPEDLLIHILDPNREVSPSFVNYSVATTDGRILSGLLAEESANSVTLKRAEGATDVVPRSRIESIASSGLSLMPEGLEKGLTPQDLSNLIAYVRSIQPVGPR